MGMFKKIVLASSGVIATLGANAVMAADYTAKIGTAETDANTNGSAVMLACIGVASLAFGAGLVIRWLSR